MRPITSILLAILLTAYLWALASCSNSPDGKDDIPMVGIIIIALMCAGVLYLWSKIDE